MGIAVGIIRFSPLKDWEEDWEIDLKKKILNIKTVERKFLKKEEKGTESKIIDNLYFWIERKDDKSNLYLEIIFQDKEKESILSGSFFDSSEESADEKAEKYAKRMIGEHPIPIYLRY